MSGEFARSEQATKLLRFVVFHALDRPDTGLTERAIASEIFDRNDDWDPKIDPAVRIAFGRLRNKLKDYYGHPGANDPVLIRLPRGTYVPQFEYSPDISELSSDLELPAQLSSAVGAQSKGRRYLVWGAMVVLLLAVLDAAVHVRRFELGSPLETRPYTTSAFTAEAGREYSPAISPDGRSIAFVWDQNGQNYNIYVREVGGGDPQRLTSSTDSEFSPSWSPDGRQIAFVRISGVQAHIIVKPRASAEERVVASMRYVSGQWTSSMVPQIDDIGPVWSPDGASLVFSDVANHGLFEIAMATGAIRRLTPAYDLSKDLRDFYPRYSPDGKYLAFAHYTSHGVGDIYTFERKTGNIRQVTFDERAIRGESWTPDRQQLVFASSRGGQTRLWLIDGVNAGPPRLLPSDSSYVSDPAVSPDGKWIAYIDSEETWNMWRAEITPSGIRAATPFLPTSGRNHDPRYSPDGRHVAFVSDRSGNWEIWQADADGRNLTQLTKFGGPWLGGVSWSPDGTQLAFDARPDGHSNVYLLRIADRQIRALNKTPYEDRMPTWSRDGRFIYFSSTRDGSISLYREDLKTGAISSVFLNTFSAEEGFEPDTIYLSRVGRGFEVSRINGAVGPTLPQLVHPSPALAWAVSRSGFYFATGVGPNDPFSIFRLTNGELTKIGKVDKKMVESSPSLTVSPAGDWMIVAQQDHVSSNVKIRHLF